MKADRIVFGVAILAVGLVWLLVNLGLIPAGTARELWRYWPLLLILWGVLMVLGKGHGISGCLVAILVVMLVFGGIFAVFYPTSRTTGPDTTYPVFVETVGEAERVKLDLVHHAGEFSLSAHQGSHLLEGTIRASHQPDIEQSGGRVSEVTLRDPSGSWPFQNRVSRWELRLTEHLPADIIFRTGATQAELNLSRLQVNELDIKMGAGDLKLYLGTNDIDIRIEGGAGSITLFVPDETGVRLRATGGLLSVSGEDARVVGIGERRYESSDIDEKDAVADVQVTAGAGSVEIKRSR